MMYSTPNQISEMIGLKYTTVLSWAKKGILPARIIPNGKKCKYFFVIKEVVEKIEKHKTKKL